MTIRNALFLCLFITTYVHADVHRWSVLPSEHEIALLLPEKFPLLFLTYQSDVKVSSDEFYGLTQLHQGMNVSGHELYIALKRLFQKNKFQSIAVTIDTVPDGISVHIDLAGVWTFRALKISGIWVGRDWYKQYYLMEHGDVFDAEKHRLSMEKIKEICARDGFFNTSITSSFDYDERTKSVSVRVTINRGKRFTIIDSPIEFTADPTVSTESIASVNKAVAKKFVHGLRKSKYGKVHLEETARLIKKYLAHQGFLDVTISLNESLYKARHHVKLEWHINLGKKRTFIFFGNKFFSNYQLLDRMLQFGRSAWILPASMLAQELTQAYHAKGFWSVDIAARDEEEKSFFVIKEGIRATIESITIQGAHALEESVLIKACFSKLKRRMHADQELLQASFDTLVGYYLRHGFLQAKIVDHELIPSDVPGIYTLAVTLQEGERVCVDSFSIPGHEHLEQAVPFKRMRGQTTPFDTAIIQEQKNWLREYFRKQGYVYAQVTPTLQSKDDQDKQHLVWNIDPKEPVRFGKTIIQGVDVLPYHCIMRELAYKEGQLWDHDLIRRSFLRLKDRQLFDGVSFSPMPSDNPHERDVLLKYHLDDPYELRIRAGIELQHIQQYQTFGGLAYRAGGTFMVKNPTNHADLFRFDVDIARAHREAHLNYWYPWIGGFPMDGVIQGYSIKYDQPPVTGGKKNLYTVFQNGVLFGLRHKDVYWDLGGNVGFEVARTKISKDDVCTQQMARDLACAMNFDPRLLNKRVPFVFVEPTVMINLLDNSLDPTRGIFSLLSLRGMFPTNETFSESFMVKLLVEHSCFASIGPAVTALRVRFGHIFHRKFCDIMPSERFYLGGAHSVRSYESDQAPPLGCFVDSEGKAHTVARGGKTMLNLNLELRIATFNKVTLVPFQDIGYLSGDSLACFTAKNIVAGTGFGVRLATPIGPLRFDIAWKWKTSYPDERKYTWFLTFGQAF